MQKTNEILLAEHKAELPIVLNKIATLERQQSGGYTAQVSKSFHLGMVGGSGRNIHSLNKKRSRELDATIDRAKSLTELYKRRNWLEAQIKDIEEGGPEKREVAKQQKNEKLAEWWRNLKVDDDLLIRGDQKTPVTKKNKKSCETGAGCIWKADEIIGKEAAALL